MNRNTWVRQIHRWTSVVFTAAVVVVSILVLGRGEPAEWVYLSPLPPLALLLLTGAYLFVLPYVARRRGGAPAPESHPPRRRGTTR